MAPVIMAVKTARFGFRVIFTGQHKETVDELMGDFGLPSPDFTLYDGPDITRTAQIVPWMLKVMWTFFRMRKRILVKNERNIFLVHGDTISTVLGAIMGRLTRQTVGHLESGLRSFRLFDPFPEELQRLATFALSQVYFCPGQWALNNLKKYSGEKIDIRYNTLIDSLRLAMMREDLKAPDFPQKPFCLVSIHRYENISRRNSLLKVIKLVEKIANSFLVVFVLHPPTIVHLKKFGLLSRLENNHNIELRPRYSYVRFIKLLAQSEFIVTDGGSNQEECSYLGHPCLLMRAVTERVEGLNKNVVVSDFQLGTVDSFIAHYSDYRRPAVQAAVSPSELVLEYLRNNNYTHPT